MEAAHNTVKMLITSWRSLRDAHPDQIDLTEMGFNGTAESFDETFVLWEKLLDQLVSSADTDPESSIVEQRIVKIMLDIRSEIDASKANSSGFKGLFQNANFLPLVCEAATLISSSANKRSNFLSELIRLAKNNIGKDFSSIKDAASKARKLLKQYESIDSKATRVAGAETKATASATAIDAIKSNAETSQKDITEIRGKATTAKEELDKIAENLRASNKTSSDTLSDIVKKKQDLEKEISELNESVRQAQTKVLKALQDISREGLAGSFTKQARTIGWERFWWLAAFVATICALTIVPNLHNNSSYSTAFKKTVSQQQQVLEQVPGKTSAQSVASSPLTTEGDHNSDWWKAILQELPFAAPLIWFGWLSTRQIGVLSKIRQDYSYKACTALAFEGYKKELSDANDPALSKQLLETAIRNFGENPIRLYGGKDDHGMPIEELVSHIFDEKTLDKWLPQISRICEVIGKCFGSASKG